MEDLWSSPPRVRVEGNWKSPARTVIRYLAHEGISDGKILRRTGIPKLTMMLSREIRRVIRFISKDYSTRRLTFERVRAQLGIEASSRTIRRVLRKAGYKRCIACARPYTTPD